MTCGPLMEFSRKSFIDDRDSPSYSRISFGFKSIVVDSGGEGEAVGAGVGAGVANGVGVEVGIGVGVDTGYGAEVVGFSRITSQ